MIQALARGFLERKRARDRGRKAAELMSFLNGVVTRFVSGEPRV